MSNTHKSSDVISRVALSIVAGLLAGLCFVHPVAAQTGDHADQGSVEELVWRIALGIKSEENPHAFLGQDVVTDEFFRVTGDSTAALVEKEELARLPAIAPVIGEDDLRSVGVAYMHVAIFGLTAIATATVAGEDQTFAIMCIETRTGWKIAALQTGRVG